jgi:hypothetical protein
MLKADLEEKNVGNTLKYIITENRYHSGFHQSRKHSYFNRKEHRITIYINPV